MAWFRPDLIDPASDVPIGIGAVAFVRLLEAELGIDESQVFRRMIDLQPTRWAESKRPLQPIDVEYLCCECRKYWSYVSGAKAFEGKNVFVPGESPLLYFDEISYPDGLHEDTAAAAAAAAASDPAVYVIAGAPCSGKSSLVDALKASGLRTEPETAERMIQQGLASGSTAERLRSDAVEWQLSLMREDYALFERLFTSPAGSTVLTDTSFVESERSGI